MPKNTAPKKQQNCKKLTSQKREAESATPNGKTAGEEPRVMRYIEPESFLLPGEGKDWLSDDPDKPLTHQQWAFVGEYQIDFHAGAAMRRAGYKGPETHTTRLLKMPNIRKALARVLAERYAANRMTADKMLANIVRIVDASLGDFLDWEGTTIKLKAASEIPPAKRALLSELSHGDNGVFKIKLHDKLAAIEKGMKHLGMYDRNRQAVSRPADVTRETIKAVRAGTLSVDDAIMDLDMEGLPIPRSLELLATRQKVVDDSAPDDGSYSPTSPEEMAAKAAERRAKIEKQREEFLPQRRAEVQEIKEELGQGAFVPGGE